MTYFDYELPDKTKKIVICALNETQLSRKHFRTLENVLSVVVIIVSVFAPLAFVSKCPPSRIHIPLVARSFITALNRFTLIVHILTAYSSLKVVTRKLKTPRKYLLKRFDAFLSHCT